MKLSPAFMIIAHRGASSLAPESTAASITKAIQSGAQMIELDVQMTQDRRLVVFHDDRLERTTNGTGRLVDKSYKEISRLNAGSWFHPRFSKEKILLLSRALQLIPSRMLVNIELKRTRHWSLLIRHFTVIIRKFSVQRRLIVSSFDHTMLDSKLLANFARALICSDSPDLSLRKAIRINCSCWHPLHSLVTKRLVAVAHAAGLRVHAWTVDEPRMAIRLARLGVDGLFTNNPSRLIRLLS